MVIFGLNLIRKCKRNIRVFGKNFDNIIFSTNTKSFFSSSRIFYCQNFNKNQMSFENSVDLFSVETDRFQGVIVKAEKEFNCDVEHFTNKLNYSLSKWISDGVRTVWFYISLKHSIFIPVLTANDFVFHRVNDATGQTLVMYRWLPKDRPSSIPPYAHTMVGVGGIVINEKNELLTVYQSYGKWDTWKLPGGYVEQGEDLPTAVIREVEEETGIKTEFKSCVLFRHTHHANYDCSDLYFITALEPLTEEVNEDSEEVLKVKWMPFQEFLDHPSVHELNKSFIRTYLQQQNDSVVILKNDGIHPITKKPYTCYRAALNKHDS